MANILEKHRLVYASVAAQDDGGSAALDLCDYLVEDVDLRGPPSQRS
jgi:hypothetical protein